MIFRRVDDRPLQPEPPVARVKLQRPKRSFTSRLFRVRHGHRKGVEVGRPVLVGEVPAGGAVGLGGGHADGSVQREAVQVPGGGARAGRAVRGRERVALH